jgi:hypothetical protein
MLQNLSKHVVLPWLQGKTKYFAVSSLKQAKYLVQPRIQGKKYINNKITFLVPNFLDTDTKLYATHIFWLVFEVKHDILLFEC